MNQNIEFRQAFKNIKRVFGGELNNYTEQHRADILIITASNNMNLPENMQGNYQETEQLFDKAETIYKNTLDLQNPGDLNSLGELYLLHYAHKFNSSDILTKAKDTLSQAITIINDKNDISIKSRAPKDKKLRNQYIKSNFLLYKVYNEKSEYKLGSRHGLECYNKQREHLNECMVFDKSNPLYYYLYAELVFKNRNIIPKREKAVAKDPLIENLEVARHYCNEALNRVEYMPSIINEAKLLDKQIQSQLTALTKN